ncbi:F-box protein CPR30-like, partial [Durio zibethinus]|uniref:F-box protein CPR30-like n=1 Tax=Durio zibethinus TaxID=66656 RepID=A0A6P5X4B7_DURZI
PIPRPKARSISLYSWELEPKQMMGNLPLDIIADILSRLPVKHLLCLRCVSKLWRSLIDDPDFIKLHLRQSLKSHTNHTLILKMSDLHAADLACLGPFAKLEQPLMSYNQGIKILGSCNGLLCISNIVEDMAIWNPSTRKHRVLPSLGYCKGYVYGFGHDPITDDYKVVKIMQLGGVDGKALESEVKVCSLKINRWRKIQDIPCVYSFPVADGVFATGALHWVLTQKVQLSEKNVIVALDLGAENFREVPQPEYKDKIFQLNVGVLGGCLCAIANYDHVRVDLWVMKEYGVKESWTKLFSIASEEVIGSLRFVKPLAYSRSGDQVLLEHDNINLFWYDLKKKKKVNDVWIPGMPHTYETEIWLQSLVSLDVNRRQHDGEDNKGIKKMDDFLSEGFKLVL